MTFALFSFLVGAATGHRLYRGALALLLSELEAEEPPEHPVERLPVLGPVLSMVWFSRLAQLWAPARPLPDARSAVGLVCGLATAAFAMKLGPAWPFFGVAPLVVVLIVAAACDLLSGIVLDELSGLAFLHVLAYVAVTHAAAAAGFQPQALEPPYPYDTAAIRLDTGLWSVLLIGLGLALFNLRSLVTGELPNLGGGVVKLLLSVALLTGWKGALASFVLAVVIAVVPAGVVLFLQGRREQEPPAPTPAEGATEPGSADDSNPNYTLFPFVPFLGLGALVTLWVGHAALAGVYLAVNARVVGWLTSGILR